MRGRKKTDATRQAIVAGAATVFARRDFHEVLIEDIAQELGIGKGTLYRYFASKEALYIAVIADGLMALHTAVLEVLGRDAPLATTIEGLVRTLVLHFWRRRDFFLLMARMEPKLDARERADWRERRAEVVSLIRRVLGRAAAAGEIGRLNTRLATEVLFGMIRGACMYRADSDRPEDVTRLVTGIFLTGIAQPAPRKRPAGHPLTLVHGGATRA